MKDETAFWNALGHMVYVRLPELVADASKGLSKALLNPPSRLKASFEPNGPWCWDGPVWRGARSRRSFWYRASTIIEPDHLRPRPFEDKLLSYLNSSSYPQPVSDVDVYLTYKDQS